MSESVTLDITDDLTEAQLSEEAMTEEIVVYWRGDDRERHYGIIVGVEVDKHDMLLDTVFVIDEVERTAGPTGEDTWREVGRTTRLSRQSFTVFGPANLDPENRPNAPHEVAIELLRSTKGFDQSLTPFLCAAIEIAARTQEHDSSTPAFNVRLDIKHVDTDGQGHRMPWRRNRLMVRATEDPMMHDEIEWVLGIASKYELSGFHSNVGIEIRQPDDSV